MKGVLRVVMLVLMCVVLSGSAFAVPAAYTGKMGNDEEPALRPYKWLWHGVKSFFHHPGARAYEGNARYPVIGLTGAGTGVVQGTIDLGESAAKGSVHAIPPQAGDYKNLGTANTYLANDIVFGPIVNAPLAIAGAIENDPEAAQARQDAVLEKAAETRAARKAGRQDSVQRKDSFEKARESYIGERAHINPKPAAERDMTKAR
jgi:hypothetical protein